MNIYNFLVKVDKFCDYVPVVGTITNLVDLFEKAVMKPTNHSSNNYKIHIMQKKHCAMLLIPVFGSIYVYFANKKEQNANLAEAEAQAQAEEAVEACRKGDYEKLETLFDQGLNPNLMVDGSPIIFSSLKNPHLLQLLIEKGADVKVKNSVGRTVFYESISAGREASAIAVLNSDEDRDVDQQLEYGGPPLVWACGLGWLDLVQALLGREADVNIVSTADMVAYPNRSVYYSTPLLNAILKKNVALVELLIENKARVDNEASTQKIINPIQVACELNPINKPILKLLLDNIEGPLEPALAKAVLEAVCRQGDYKAFDLVSEKCRKKDLAKNVNSLREIVKWQAGKGHSMNVDDMPWLIENKLNELFPSQ